MATTMQTFPKMLKMLRENSSAKEKREALTYISSNARKLDTIGIIKEEQYKELCKLVIETFVNMEQDAQYEAYEALCTIIQDFKHHKLNLFESLLQTNRKNRLKILKLLEVLEDSAISSAAKDGTIINFFNDCMHTVQPHAMELTASAAATDNSDILMESEVQSLSDEQKLEEEMINYAVALLRRLYKVAEKTTDQTIHRFDTLLMDKIVTLAYMGQKRQRGTALKLLKEAVTPNFATYIRTNYPDVWTQYKSTLQTVYCKRMLLLVGTCDIDWATQWNISIQFLGTDLHHGANLINNLLSVEERAFKSTDSIIRRQAFLSWKLLVDNFALDPQELATARRIKLLCIPLNAKNSKTELIALTKLEVWWHLIIKLYKDISKFVNPVITQFLNFCFGPLGDTPLLSTKFDVVASPGKRFSKTKVVAIDALRQLLVPKQESHTDFAGVLEERLPYSISNAVFQECYKSIIHSVGEALLVLSQLTDKDMKNRSHIGKTLWINLINYVKDANMEIENLLYKDIILLIIELLNHATEKPLINDLILNSILLQLGQMFTEVQFNDDALSKLVLKLLSTEIFLKMERVHYDAIKSLMWQYIKTSEGVAYHSNTLNFLSQVVERMNSISVTNESTFALSEMWCILAEILIKYMEDRQQINEGSSTKHTFPSVQSILLFPFTRVLVSNVKQAQKIVKIWRKLYREFESQADLFATVKPNEIIFGVADLIQACFKEDDKCCHLAVHCVDVLLSTINYKTLLHQYEVPSIVKLIVDLSVHSLKEAECESEVTLRALSTMLITAFGHDPEKVVTYLNVSKPAIELMLANRSSSLYKEITSTWETVVSIFKGLNKLLTYDLLSSFREIILQAVNHPSSDIQNQALSILEIREGVQETTKCLLEDLYKKVKQDKLLSKSDSIKKSESVERRTLSSDAVVCHFNRKPGSSKTTLSKQTNKDERNVPHSLDSNSEEYVLIKTDLNFDVNRLTENQKESFKRRRDDIPAICNDLSQSSSQSTQQIRDWFSPKNKYIEAVNRPDTNKKDNAEKDESIDHDANKENKIEATEPESGGNERSLATVNETKSANDAPATLAESSKDTSDATKARDEVISENKLGDPDATCDSPETTEMITESVSDEMTDPVSASKSVAKRLDFESREEFPEENIRKRQGSPSVLDCSKRRSRSSVKIAAPTSASDDATNDQDEETSGNEVRASKRTGKLKPKFDQNKTIVKESVVINQIKRGLKRKTASDSELDPNMHLRRRRKLSNSVEIPPSDADSEILPEHIGEASDERSLNQRSKKEISRLKINMVFDCSQPRRRRSKAQDESNKDADAPAERRAPSPDNKGVKLKSADVKPAEQAPKDPKKASKVLETDAKSVVAQSICTRRMRRSLRQETDKGEEFQDSANEKRSSEIKENGSEIESAESATDSPADILSTLTEDKENSVVEKLNTNISDEESTPNDEFERDEELSNSEPPAKEKPTDRDDAEDIVESSQHINKSPKLDKKSNNKQCFVSLDKITDSRIVNSYETAAADVDVPESNITDSDIVEKLSGSEDPKNDNVQSDLISLTETDKTETVEDDRVEITQEFCNTQQDNAKSLVVESSQKSNKNSALCKPASSAVQLSPKSNLKRYSKLKAYPTGRAAHMLGLVTKHGLMENDSAIIRVDEDIANKKIKSRDAENEPAKKEKPPVTKEVEKIGGPCGSRQEKIFSNMRSTDYNLSPPIKMFSNLKNDGEKISSKVEKRTSDATILGEQAGGKENEGNLSPPHERDDLPMLEWSSANPPSLTASPSASILKRNRTIVLEPDTDSTPNKRKRVSFADPPVSKEMGYEISSAGSPHKISKMSTPRGFLPRKDSPLRHKQSKLKFIQIDMERAVKESDVQEDNSSEVDLQCERENELLSKIAEELEYTENMSMDVEPSTSCNYMDIDGMPEAAETRSETKMVRGLEDELEGGDSLISDKANLASHNGSDPTKRMNVPVNLEAEESETQQDIFSCVDEKNSPESTANRFRQGKPNSFAESVSADHLKVGVTNDSVMAALPDDDTHLEQLEDTVDVQNVTNLNFTVNCEEMFSGKLIRTSTQSAENTAEQDTLPVTDSMFASHDSDQVSQEDAEVLQSEPAESDRQMLHNLVSSNDLTNSTIKQLANQLSIERLSAYLAEKGLRTVGDLAQLSEREISNILVKGEFKDELVKNVLLRFRSMHPTQERVPSGSAFILKSKVPVETREAFIRSIHPDNSIVNATDATKSVEVIPETNPSAPSNKARTSNVACTESIFDVSDGKYPDSNSQRTLGNERLADAKSASSASVNVSNSTSDRTMSVRTCSVSSTLENSSGCTFKTIGTVTDPVHLATKKATKCVASQMALEDLLDEIDVNLVLESAVRRCTPQHILSEYKTKMRHMSETELGRETLRMIGVENKPNCSDVSLKSVCRACGVNKVLLRLPDIFSADKQFFVKVFKAYCQKIRASDCLEVLDPAEVKEAICQKCTSSELAQILSKRLKEEESQGIRTPMTELSSLNAMLKRMPMDVIISHTVANDELIPSQVVLDIALQNNTPDDIMAALQSRSPMVTKNMFEKLLSPQCVVKYIQDNVDDKEELLGLYKAVCAKLSMQDLINASHESMREKIETMKEKK